MLESGESKKPKKSRFPEALKQVVLSVAAFICFVSTILIIWAIIYPIYAFAISVSDDLHKSMKANGWFRGEYYEAPRNPPREFIKTRYH